MRVPPWAVGVAATAIKLWLWWRAAPIEVHHIICVVSLGLLVSVMAAIWMQRTEPKAVNEIYCAEEAQEHLVEERCEFKLRSVRSRGIPPHEGRIA